MKIKRYYSRNVYKEADVKFVRMGNISEIRYLSHRNNKCRIKKINKDEYVRLETGEIIEVNHFDNRGQNIHGIRQSIGHLRELINNNFTGGRNELWVTLTFGENKVFDASELYDIFKNFIKRLRYYLKPLKVDYICVPEPHEKGDWHIHLLLKADGNLYVPNKKLSELWGHGFVKVNRMKDIDNLGAYLSAYLIDIKDGEETKKGARLYLYPPQHKLYRCSRGIKFPEVLLTTYENALKEVEGHKKTFETNTEVQIGDFKGLYHCEYYNRIHKKDK